jgi:hypothetical protein
MKDDLDQALAREEHAQGLTYTQADHCERCYNEVIRRRIRWLVASCQHDGWVDISTLSQAPGTVQICATCGASTP